MADDEQNQQPPRYWFPYWSGAPQPPPPSRPSRPPVRPQQSRRLSPPSPSVAPSSPRRPSPSPQHRQQPTTATATRGPAPPTPPQSQVSRPPPSRTSPLAPIRAPAPPSNNSNAGFAATPAPPVMVAAKPVVVLLPAAPEAAPRQKDVDVVLPTERSIAQVQQPAAAAETKPHGGHGKAGDKEHKAHHHKDEHKSKEKEKEKDHKEKKDETKSKEKKKDHKEKEKKQQAGEDGKHKEAKAEHGKLHREIKAGVADMVQKATGAAASGSGHGDGHERGATSVITLAGENKGSSMKVGGGKSKDGGEWHGHGHRLDGGSDGKKSAGKAGMMTALINSNVQVINNSLLLQSSCNGGDPGVHLKLSAKSASKEKQKHAGGGDKAGDAGKK